MSQDVKIARWTATIAGLIGFVLSVATPLLPVVQTTATLNWPQNGQLNNVTAPLISQVPVTMTVTVPCDVIRSMPPAGGMVLGTAPKNGKQAALQSLFVNVNSQRVDITDRNVVVASVPRARVSVPGCQRIEITSSEAGTFATFVGLTDPTTGKEQRTGFADPNLRPSIVGIFTDLTGPAPPGLSASAVIDTRFSTRPTVLKLAAMVLAIVATIVALVALWRLDRLDGHRMQRWLPGRWRTFSATDVVVIGGFLVWHVIGANSSDDGYILQMARVAGHAGYMSNYFRWFGSPEDPFGWYYNLLALMTGVSDASIWIRLPDLVCGIVCWLLLSREVLPRLGPAVVASKPAVWAAGLVLLAAWMPFNNGLRPEGQIATGALITYVLIERAIISSRMTPAALAILTAAFTLGIQPTGLIAVAALLAGGRPILRILVKRHRIVGTWPLIAPLLAAGTVVLTVVFADQTLATVLEATRIRTAIGPSQPWYTENLRYYYLILPTVDGSLSRRFGFLITALCLFTAMFIMLRRKRVPGVARGPVWRLMGVILGTMFFLMFTPTKWVHHFGLFAAVGAAMAAVATVLVSPVVLRSARNRMAFTAGVLFVLALCFSTTNGWWYVSSFGVPFNNAIQPGPKTYDVDVNEFSITDERKQAVDFSAPYYDVTQAVIALKSSKIAGAKSLADLKGAKLGAQVGTTSLRAITESVKPTAQPQVYNNNDDAKKALQNGQIDGLVVDLPTAFYITSAEIDNSTIVGQLPQPSGTPEQFGLVLDKGSSLTSCVSQAVTALKSDGTLANLEKQWLAGVSGAPVLS